MAEETKKTTASKSTSTTTKKSNSTTTKKAAPKKPAEPKVETVVEPKEVETPVEVKEEVVAEAPKAEAKPAKKAKKEAKVEPQKPARTEATATAYDVRVTPRKARLVIDLVRGKKVNDALGILANTNKAASPIVAKVIKSAASNAINNFGMKEEDLYVATIYANEGIKMKRFLPRAKGSASGLVKRSSHITVVVKAK